MSDRAASATIAEQVTGAVAAHRPMAERDVDELRALEWPGSGQTVLCLPGLGSVARSWQHLAGELPDARIVAPELRGRGSAAGLTGEPGLASHARDVARVVTGLGLSEVVIVGHSMGAFLAPLVAAEIGDRASRIVLVDGGVPPKLPPVLRPWVVRLAFAREVRQSWGPWRRPEDLVDKVFGKTLRHRPDLREEFVDVLGSALLGPAGALHPAWDRNRIIADALDTFFNPVVRAAFDNLPVPAHLLWCSAGKHETARPMYTQTVVSAALARQPALTAQHVPGVNHVTLAYSPELFKVLQG